MLERKKGGEDDSYDMNSSSQLNLGFLLSGTSSIRKVTLNYKRETTFVLNYILSLLGNHISHSSYLFPKSNTCRYKMSVIKIHVVPKIQTSKILAGAAKLSHYHRRPFYTFTTKVKV